MNAFCIADEDTVRGLRLAGIDGLVVRTPEESLAALQLAAAKTNCGLVIITDAIAESIRNQVDTMRLEHAHPLIVEIPGPQGPLPGRKTLRQLLQEAVGLPVGLGETN